MAQGFDGVSLGGTTIQPILINNSGQAVVGYVIRRDTTTGVSVPFVIFPADRTMLDQTIKSGQQSEVGGMGLGAGLAGEGQSLGYTLMGVLFADGTYIGPSRFAQQFQAEVNFCRDYAKNKQVMANRQDAIRQDAAIQKGPPIRERISMPRERQG